MKSPCVKVCIMDPQREVCMGCGRTLDEIAHWGVVHCPVCDALERAVPVTIEVVTV